jgi:Protein of unknown function (DUF3800)
MVCAAVEPIPDTLPAEARRTGAPRGTFVHLAYLDDSDTKAKQHKWQVMSAVLVEDKAFKLAEAGMSAIPGQLIGSDKIEQFEEFHACELYGGYGVFAGIDQSIRFNAISSLLTLINVLELTVIYGAVDLSKLHRELYGSADPMDVCFRICLRGIDDWAEKRLLEKIRKEPGDEKRSGKLEEVVFRNLLEELVILILDECDGKVKANLVRSFREVRPSYRSGFTTTCLHDDMYFGDSRYSLGIQLADLCSYFIARHLEGNAESEGFFEMIEPHIIYCQSYPSPSTAEIVQALEEPEEEPPKELGDGKQI